MQSIINVYVYATTQHQKEKGGVALTHERPLQKRKKARKKNNEKGTCNNLKGGEGGEGERRREVEGEKGTNEKRKKAIGSKSKSEVQYTHTHTHSTTTLSLLRQRHMKRGKRKVHCKKKKGGRKSCMAVRERATNTF